MRQCQLCDKQTSTKWQAFEESKGSHKLVGEPTGKKGFSMCEPCTEAVVEQAEVFARENV